MSSALHRLLDGDGRSGVATFDAAYVVSLVGCVVSGGLTAVYVGGGLARELNLVVVLLFRTVGPVGVVLVKGIVVIAGYWALSWIGEASSLPRVATAFAWVGAGVNVVDAAHDTRVAMLVGVPDTAVPTAAVPVAVGVLAVGLCCSPVHDCRDI